jgi:hypothetical protein
MASGLFSNTCPQAESASTQAFNPTPGAALGFWGADLDFSGMATNQGRGVHMPMIDKASPQTGRFRGKKRKFGQNMPLAVVFIACIAMNLIAMTSDSSFRAGLPQAIIFGVFLRTKEILKPCLSVLFCV